MSSTIRQFVKDSLHGFYERLKNVILPEKEDVANKSGLVPNDVNDHVHYPTVGAVAEALESKETSNNKLLTMTGYESSGTMYPSANAVTNYVDQNCPWKKGSALTSAKLTYVASGDGFTQASGTGSFVAGGVFSDSDSSFLRAEGIGSCVIGAVQDDYQGSIAPSYISAENYGAVANGYVYLDSESGEGECGGSIQATGRGSHAEGWVGSYYGESGGEIKATGNGSHAEGCVYSQDEDPYGNVIASGMGSHAEGTGTTSSGYVSHAEGFSSVAAGRWSHAEGQSTRTYYDGSHAEGYNTYATGYNSHAEGRGTYAFGNYSHSSGYGSYTQSNFRVSGSAGTTTYTTSAAHNLKIGDIIYIDYWRLSRVEDIPSSTSFTVDHTLSTNAVSNKNVTVLTNVAYGLQSFTSGNGVIASNSSESAFGFYNVSNSASGTVEQTYAGSTNYSIGVGGSSTSRKNAFEVMKNGDVYVYGIGGYDGTNPNTTGVYTLQGMLDGIETLLAAI